MMQMLCGNFMDEKLSSKCLSVTSYLSAQMTVDIQTVMIHLLGEFLSKETLKKS